VDTGVAVIAAEAAQVIAELIELAKRRVNPSATSGHAGNGKKNPVRLNGVVNQNANSCWPSETLMRSTSVGFGGWPWSNASGACGRNASGNHGAM
jgi:hypothetical protein